MRIAIVVRAESVWGAETSLLTLLGAEASRRNQITVICPPWSPIRPLLEDIEHVDVLEFDFGNYRSIRRGGIQKAGLKSAMGDALRVGTDTAKLARVLRGFDVCMSFGLWETPAVGLAARIARIPMIFDFHVTFQSNLGRRLYPVLQGMARCVIVPAEATLRQAGVSRPSSKVAILPRPVQVQTSLARNLNRHVGTQLVPTVASSGTKLRVGIFGQVQPHKQVLELLRAGAHMSSNVEFIVMGLSATPDRTDYEQQVAEACSMYNWVAMERDTNVLEVMETCDVVVNCSTTEAFGRTVVEGLLLGLTPVVLEGGGPAEIVRSLQFGFVEPTVPAIADRLMELAQERFKTPIEPPIEDVLKWRAYFSPEVIADRYFSVVESAVRT